MNRIYNINAISVELVLIMLSNKLDGVRSFPVENNRGKISIIRNEKPLDNSIDVLMVGEELEKLITTKQERILPGFTISLAAE